MEDNWNKLLAAYRQAKEEFESREQAFKEARAVALKEFEDEAAFLERTYDLERLGMVMGEAREVVERLASDTYHATGQKTVYRDGPIKVQVAVSEKFVIADEQAVLGAIVDTGMVPALCKPVAAKVAKWAKLQWELGGVVPGVEWVPVESVRITLPKEGEVQDENGG